MHKCLLDHSQIIRAVCFLSYALFILREVGSSNFRPSTGARANFCRFEKGVLKRKEGWMRSPESNCQECDQRISDKRS